MSDIEIQHAYEQVLATIKSLCEGELDEIALMATIASELHNNMPGFDWTGFYRVTSPNLLKIGPYQGGHGCLHIPFDRGVCGKAATTGKTQLVSNVNDLPYHIACSSSTQSEIVVPVFDHQGNVRAVLDIDSNQLSRFTMVDKQYLEQIAAFLIPAYS